jgi:DNA-directed RNA polymerase II subunit RPB1
MNTGEEIRAGITKYERFTKNNTPIYGGINDPRMGSFNSQIRCKTCDCTYAGSGSKMDDCPGHFGHIELVRPVYHCGFIDEVVKILRCVCYHCSRLLLDEKVFKDRRALSITDPATRLRCIHDSCKSKTRCIAATVSDSVKILDEVGVFDNRNDTHTRSTTQILNEFGVPISSEVSEIPNTGCGGLMPKYTRKGK